VLFKNTVEATIEEAENLASHLMFTEAGGRIMGDFNHKLNNLLNGAYKAGIEFGRRNPKPEEDQ
jgi:hypothetical protein